MPGVNAAWLRHKLLPVLKLTFAKIQRNSKEASCQFSS